MPPCNATYCSTGRWNPTGTNKNIKQKQKIYSEVHPTEQKQLYVVTNQNYWGFLWVHVFI